MRLRAIAIVMLLAATSGCSQARQVSEDTVVTDLNATDVALDDLADPELIAASSSSPNHDTSFPINDQTARDGSGYFEVEGGDGDEREEPRREFDEESARDAARSNIRVGQFSRYSRGYICTEDCEGHEAGFDWAKENRVNRRSNCYGDSNSFTEGCEAFVKAIDREVEDRRSRYESGDDNADRY